MPNDKKLVLDSINEIAGRLWIWETSLLKTKDLLNLAFRANLNKPQPELKDKFPTYIDSCAIYENSIELAIIYFCQIYTRGKPKSEIIAVNNPTFINEHLNKIINKVFDSDEKLKKYTILQKNILITRHKIIAHADGSSFNISHGPTFSVMKGKAPFSIGPLMKDGEPTSHIDVEFWESFLEPLKIEIVNYTNALKIKQTV